MNLPMNVYDAIATVGWILLVVGWIFRRNRSRHLGFVLPGMGIDLGLVVYLEMTRAVIEKTTTVDYTPLQWIHIGSSVAATVLYLPTIVFGVMLLRRAGGPSVRTWHKRCAIPALGLRTIGFAFMWAF